MPNQYPYQSATKRLYDSRRWRKASKQFLSNPLHCLCAICLQFDRSTPSVLVDHIKPHNGNVDLFWDTSNWQGLCSSCHSGIKRQLDHGKIIQACDTGGNPISPAHHWNK